MDTNISKNKIESKLSLPTCKFDLPLHFDESNKIVRCLENEELTKTSLSTILTKLNCLSTPCTDSMSNANQESITNFTQSLYQLIQNANVQKTENYLNKINNSNSINQLDELNINYFKNLLTSNLFGPLLHQLSVSQFEKNQTNVSDNSEELPKCNPNNLMNKIEDNNYIVNETKNIVNNYQIDKHFELNCLDKSIEDIFYLKNKSINKTHDQSSLKLDSNQNQTSQPNGLNNFLIAHI